jgi:hypothetical protein
LRSFLLGTLKNYAVQRHRARTALKRGGGRVFVEIDAFAEQRYAHETSHADTPEREFDRAWARQLLASVLADDRRAVAPALGGLTADTERLLDDLSTVVDSWDDETSPADASRTGASQAGTSPSGASPSDRRANRR